MTATTFETPIDPRAIDLASYLVGPGSLQINEVQMFTWMAKAHFGTTSDNRAFRLILAGHGAWEMAFKDDHGEYLKDTSSGHIENTPAGAQARQAAAELGRNLTGHNVDVCGWMDFSGLAVGRYLKPTGDDDAHSFVLLELSDDQYAIVHGDNPNPAFTDAPPKFEEEPFSQGNISRFNTPQVSVSCAINILDEDLFCEAMGIEGLEELSGDILTREMTLLAKDAKLCGFNSFGCTDPAMSNGFLTFDVLTEVADFGLLVCEARDRYADCWGDDGWYPASPEEALNEIALASNANPSPGTMGFEFVSMTGIGLETAKTADVDEEPQL
jgi:hypothetical protein